MLLLYCSVCRSRLSDLYSLSLPCDFPRPKRQVSAAALSTAAPPSVGSFYHPAIAGSQAQINGFFQKFLTCHDTNRDHLIDAYCSNAVFSLTVNSGVSAHGGGRYIRNAGGDTSAYIAVQHDLLKLHTHDSQRKDRMFSSKIAIINALKTLPATRHQIDSTLLLDVFPLQTRGLAMWQVLRAVRNQHTNLTMAAVLAIATPFVEQVCVPHMSFFFCFMAVRQATLRGTFVETATATGRNFVRTLLLRPAESTVWQPYSIAHDQWHIGASFSMAVESLGASSAAAAAGMSDAGMQYVPAAPGPLNFSFS